LAPELPSLTRRIPILRTAWSAIAVLVLVAALAPPFSGWARRYEWVEALQFAALGVVVPALFTAGAGWRALGLGPFVERLAAMRKRHPEPWRTTVFVGIELAAFVVWRIPVTVNWLSGNGQRALLEALVLLPAGVGFWLECIESPPLSPRTTRPVRMVVAAAGMWTVWVLAYLVGLSHVAWYRAYPHPLGAGPSLAADQQVTTGVLWFVSSCAFAPIVFWNLVLWLHSEEDPDQELYRLAKAERRRNAGRGLGGDHSPDDPLT
jgi:cytochrome c oxidase assembly factor CtaG